MENEKRAAGLPCHIMVMMRPFASRYNLLLIGHSSNVKHWHVVTMRALITKMQQNQMWTRLDRLMEETRSILEGTGGAGYSVKQRTTARQS